MLEFFAYRNFGVVVVRAYATKIAALFFLKIDVLFFTYYGSVQS